MTYVSPDFLDRFVRAKEDFKVFICCQADEWFAPLLAEISPRKDTREQSTQISACDIDTFLACPESIPLDLTITRKSTNHQPSSTLISIDLTNKTYDHAINEYIISGDSECQSCDQTIITSPTAKNGKVYICLFIIFN